MSGAGDFFAPLESGQLAVGATRVLSGLESYNEEGHSCGSQKARRMERMDYTLDGPPQLVPARGWVLWVRFKLTGHQELDWTFCDYGMRSGRALQLFNCRIKALLFENTVPCDYALKLGILTVPAEQVVELFQLPAPPWYHRLEEAALVLARQSQDLAGEIGLADLFRAITGAT